MKDILKPSPFRNILVIWLSFLVLITTLGLISSLRGAELINTNLPIPSKDTIVGLIGEDETYTVLDGRRITTLIESPDIGLLEIGVRVEGDLTAGEIFLIDELGRAYTPISIEPVETGYAFTFNLNNEDELEYKLIWSYNGTLLALLSTKK